MRHMEASLSKVYRAFPDCSAVGAKLHTMLRQAEEQVRSQRHQATYLVHIAARTAPKGLHCLSMRLTAEYFSLRPEERKLPNENKIHHPDLYHYAVFSDNVLACAAVVNSTISTAKVNNTFFIMWISFLLFCFFLLTLSLFNFTFDLMFSLSLFFHYSINL